MNIFVTGGTGFVGRHLIKGLLNAGHGVTTTGTRPRQTAFRHDYFRYISADTTEPGEWQEAVGEADVVINLAGRSIFNYWTDYYKEQMYNSRVLTTRNVVAALPKGKETVVLSTSAVGYYGDREDEELTEASTRGSGFLADLSLDWEAAAREAEAGGARVVIMRFGIVLGRDGGAFKQMLPIFRLGLGGPLGDGRQWFPWVHVDDVVGATLFAIETAAAAGTFNFTAPEPVRGREFAKEMGSALKRPAILPAPGFMIRTVMGELGAVLLSSQRALPRALLDAGYRFRFPALADALDDLT